MFQLFVDVLALVAIVAFELSVEELEVWEVKAIFLFEVDALNLLVALD